MKFEKIIKYQSDIPVTDIKDKFIYSINKSFLLKKKIINWCKSDLSQDIYGVQKNRLQFAIKNIIYHQAMIKVFISFKSFYLHLNFLLVFSKKLNSLTNNRMFYPISEYDLIQNHILFIIGLLWLSVSRYIKSIISLKIWNPL